MFRKILILSLLAQPALASMSLNDYLNGVREKNLSYQSSAERSEGSGLISRQADLIFTPQLFANGQIGHDGKMPMPANFSYDKTESEQYSLGLSQQFTFGLETKIGYEIVNTHFVGGNFGPGVQTDYWDAGPKLELSLPLWKNGFGRSARANRDLTRSQNLADKYAGESEAEGLLANAEIAYWRLSAAQEQVKIQEQALEAGQNILRYVKGRFQKSLGEKADVLQADALVQSYELQMQQAKNELQAAQRSFNIYLNLDSGQPAPDLEPLNYIALQSVAAPKARPGDRPDLRAAEARAQAANAAARLATETNRPQLDLYGSYKMNGRGEEQNEAIKDVSRDRDTAYVGLRFQMPLNVFAADDATSGARKNQAAAEKSAKYLRYEQEQAWYDIVQKLEETKQTLKLAVQMENSQKAKLENERSRLRQGRTTTYQVLLFEQDYSSAQSSRIRSAQQILALQSQIKLYQASNAGKHGK